MYYMFIFIYIYIDKSNKVGKNEKKKTNFHFQSQ